MESIDTRVHDLWKVSNELTQYLEEEGTLVSRDRLRDLLGDLSMAYFELADFLDKADGVEIE